MKAANKRACELICSISGGETAASTDRLREELGFDSMKLIRLMIALEEELGITLCEADMDPSLFETVGAVAKIVEKYTEKRKCSCGNT